MPPLLKTSVIIYDVFGHASVVTIEGACNFGVGGMIGSVGIVGSKGRNKTVND